MTPDQIAAMPAGREMDAKYRRKTPIVEAVQWDPTQCATSYPKWLWPDFNSESFNAATGDLTIVTAIGRMLIKPSNWITRRPDGKLDHFTDEAFRELFEPIPDALLSTNPSEASHEDS